jgi:hypothetical protein
MGASCLQKNQIAVILELKNCTYYFLDQHMGGHTLRVIGDGKVPFGNGGGRSGQEDPARIEAACKRGTWVGERRLCYGVVSWTAHNNEHSLSDLVYKI